MESEAKEASLIFAVEEGNIRHACLDMSKMSYEELVSYVNSHYTTKEILGFVYKVFGTEHGDVSINVRSNVDMKPLLKTALIDYDSGSVLVLMVVIRNDNLPIPEPKSAFSNLFGFQQK